MNEPKGIGTDTVYEDEANDPLDIILGSETEIVTNRSSSVLLPCIGKK